MYTGLRLSLFGVKNKRWWCFSVSKLWHRQGVMWVGRALEWFLTLHKTHLIHFGGSTIRILLVHPVFRHVLVRFSVGVAKPAWAVDSYRVIHLLWEWVVCQISISPSIIGHTMEHPKSKSTQLRSQSSLITLYLYSIGGPLARGIPKNVQQNIMDKRMKNNVVSTDTIVLLIIAASGRVRPVRGVRLRAALRPPAPLLPGPVVALLRQTHLPHHIALPPPHCPGMIT